MASVALERRAGRLPAEVTRFVGRKRELAQGRRLLEASRLVTLTGASGVGKTRLALRLAGEARPGYADGAWFVDLSALRDAELLAHTVAEALHVPDQSTRDRLDMLAEHLADRELLLVLDTCEHLVDACAILAEVLLRAAPRLHLLATSREPLDVLGEHTMVLPPLSLPDAEGPAAEVAASDAVALFADRAAAVVPGFTLSGDELPAVARLCRRLDGIPLAIELAAVRLRALSVEQLVERLDDRFRLLGTHRAQRAGRSRHQTLRAAVQWSHELCTPREALLWARLTVFPGGFDLAAAEQVCADAEGAETGLPADAVYETLARLVEKSIVLREEGGRRYRMLDTLREYGSDLLAGREEVERLRRRHRDWFLGLAVRAEAEAFGADQAGRLERLMREHANLRAALDYSVTTPGEGAQATRMAAALAQFWFSAGLLGEGRLWLGKALATDATSDRARALCLSGLLAVLQGDLEAAEGFQAEAVPLASSSLERAYTVELAGLVAFFRGDLEAARPLLAEPAPSGDIWTMLRLPLLAALHCLTGDIDRALEYCEECQVLSAASGDQWCLAYATWVRGLAHCLRGDPQTASVEAQRTLRLMRGLNDRLGSAMALDLAAGCAGFTGSAERSARLFGAADRMWRIVGAPMFFGPAYLSLRGVVLSEVRGSLGEGGWQVFYEEGLRLSLDEAMDHALDERPGVNARGVDPWEPLTRREREIAALVAQGLSNREISERLVIAKRTVDSHLEHILAKLEMASRTQIAAWVTERLRPSR
ncbi:ATP-binding protein [Actinomadura rudentiformis]|uniref:LuxR family transcriptional regulator n=1 Tax=Actinomadura rudentiformis TaxID=359158 RepID=A0A6H9YEH6_9ACTN|nr:LuxR C-terminal-related transcriptional regulator [Actinomadura rudentiformis]KAB2342084.1 LuxR family transcriptional regulator [Actinomadura rudentiformis]